MDDNDRRIEDLKRAFLERPDGDYARIQREAAEAQQVMQQHRDYVLSLQWWIIVGVPAAILIALALWAA